MEQAKEACGTALAPSRKLDQEQSFCELEKLDGGVYILNFTGEDQHSIQSEFVVFRFDERLDQVLRDTSACALITTNQGKFFSNGMDVKYLRQCDRQMAIEYLFMFQRLVSKLLTFSIPTIAVIRGHAVGAGCIFALAHDYRLMISSRAYIFMNEVNLGMSLTPGNMALLDSKLSTSVFQEAVLTGKRYNGAEAAAAGIIQVACPGWPDLLQKGLNKAMECKSKKWKRKVYHGLKMEMFKTTVRELEDGGTGFARM